MPTEAQEFSPLKGTSTTIQVAAGIKLFDDEGHIGLCPAVSGPLGSPERQTGIPWREDGSDGIVWPLVPVGSLVLQSFPVTRSPPRRGS